jgi:hypothetical protein
MKTVPYSDILNATLQLAGVDRVSLSNKTFNTFRDFFSKRIAEAWNRERWPDFIQYITRFPGLQMYSLDYVPATGTLTLRFSSDESSPYYEDTTFTSFSVGGSATIQIPKGVLTLSPTDADLNVTCTIIAGPTTVTSNGMSCVQVVVQNDTLTNSATTATESVVITSSAFQKYPYNNYIGSCLHTKNGPDGAQILPINRIKLPENADTVHGVYSRDPRTTTRTQEVAFLIEDSGVSSGYVAASEQKFIITQNTDSVCIEYSIENPVVWGDVYSSTTLYQPGAQFFYFRFHQPSIDQLNPPNDRQMKGDFYSPITSTNSGESPFTNPQNYKVIAIPDLFKDFLINAMHSDWLKSEGQFEVAMAAEQLAEKGMQDAIDKVLRQEGQVQRMNMQYTY